MNNKEQKEKIVISPLSIGAPSPRNTSRWYSMLDASSCSRVLETVQLIAERMRSPESVVAAVEAAKTQTSFIFPWSVTSFSSGFGSLVLPYLYLARSFPEQGWEDVARRYMRLAASGTQQEPFIQPGMFGGSSGLAIVLTLLTRYDKRFQNTCNTLNREITTQIMKRPWYRNTPGVSENDYDAISGVAGILSYLISTDSQETFILDAIQQLLEYLVWLGTGENELGYKKWFVPPELFQTADLHEQHSDGYFNLGLAHGIPGPLAALSLAWQAGYRIEGQREAIEHISQWIVERQLRDTWGIHWPSLIPLKASFSSTEWHQLHTARAAWCYGAPGVARSLWLAGKALEDDQLCQTALEGIEAVLRRSVAARMIDSPTLCHGVSGLLSICLRFAHEVESPLIREHIPLLVKQILEVCSPDYLLGVREEEIKDNFVDNPGFLTGAAGVVLALLAASTSVEPEWDRTLLLA